MDFDLHIMVDLKEHAMLFSSLVLSASIRLFLKWSLMILPCARLISPKLHLTLYAEADHYKRRMNICLYASFDLSPPCYIIGRLSVFSHISLAVMCIIFSFSKFVPMLHLKAWPSFSQRRTISFLGNLSRILIIS